MRYNVVINQEKCRKHALTSSEGALMDLFNQLSSWANDEVVDGKTFYHISRNKVIDELPFFFEKPDTVYRAFKSLSEKNLVEYFKKNKKDYIRLSRLGKGWNKLGNISENKPNSEINPSKFGNISEFIDTPSTLANPQKTVNHSEINPTYNIYNNTSNKREARALEFLRGNYPSRYEAFEMQCKSKIKDFKKFCLDFNDIADQEELKYTDKILFARLNRYARNWIANQSKNNGSDEKPRPYLQKIL